MSSDSDTPVFYWKHEKAPEVKVTTSYRSTPNLFVLESNQNFSKNASPYICIVHRGVCWACKWVDPGNGRYPIRFVCTDISDQETGKQILLKHFLSN